MTAVRSEVGGALDSRRGGAPIRGPTSEEEPLVNGRGACDHAVTLRAWLKFAAFVALVAALALGARALGFDSRWLSPDHVRATADRLGPAAPFAFMLIYALGSLVFIPGVVLSLAAGVAFGWKMGVLVVIVGSNLGANAAFMLAKLLGRDLVRRLARGHLERFDHETREHGLSAILALRLVPVVPFEALNFSAGLSPMKWRHYAIGTAVGMLPGTFAYVYLGGNFNYRAPQFWIAVLLLVMLACMPYVYRRWRGRRAVLEGDS